MFDDAGYFRLVLPLVNEVFGSVLLLFVHFVFKTIRSLHLLHLLKVSLFFSRVDSVALCSQILGQPLNTSTYELGSSGCGAKTDAVNMISLQSLGTAIFCFGP